MLHYRNEPCPGPPGFLCCLCWLVGGDGDYSGCRKIWAPLIIVHSAASTVIHLLNRNGGKRLVDGSSQTAMQALEFCRQKMDWRHLQTRRLFLSLIVGATLSAAAACPLAKLEGQSPLNLNIRSLWFEALGCSAPSTHLKGKRDFHVPSAHRRITPHGKLVSAAFP